MKTFLRRHIAGCALVAFSLSAAPAGAVGTRTFKLDSLDDFEGGDLTGVSVSEAGAVQAGFDLGNVPMADAGSVWSAVSLGGGAVFVGTGNEGEVFGISGGQVDLVATTGQMAVSALAVAFGGDVIAGTFPEGKLYRVSRGGNGGEAELFAELEGAEHVWGLSYDSQANALYAATGPEGKLFRIDAGGNAQVYYDSDEPHLVSVATGPDGAVYTGSSNKALLYKLTGPGRASVVYDFDRDDVKAIAVHTDGTVYAIANEYSGGFSAPKKSSEDGASPQSTKKPKPGKGELRAFQPNGASELLMEDKDTHFTALSVAADGTPHVGTGAEGRVYAVDRDRNRRLVADVEARQISAISLTGDRYVVTNDPGTFHAIKGVGGANAVWTSKVLDAGLRAEFGHLTWLSEGALELSTRSGNTEEPDDTWSDWSNGMQGPGPIQSPAARFVQIRARWSAAPSAVLREVTVHFVTDNERAVVTSLEASSSKEESKDDGVVSSGGPLDAPKSKLKVKWKVDNPDKDELRYFVFYRPTGHDTWYSALTPGEKLTKPELDWETMDLPEGIYELKIVTTDELANPPERVERHTYVSHSVLVDNTAPVFRALKLTGRRLTGEVVDGIGPVARIEVGEVGLDDWRPLFPADSIFDEPSETFDVDISTIIGEGPHLVAVRAFDTAGNSVVRHVEAK